MDDDEWDDLLLRPSTPASQPEHSILRPSDISDEDWQLLQGGNAPSTKENGYQGHPVATPHVNPFTGLISDVRPNEPFTPSAGRPENSFTGTIADAYAPRQPRAEPLPPSTGVGMGTPISPMAAEHWKQQVQDYTDTTQAQRIQKAALNPNPWTKQQVGNIEAAIDRVQMRDNLNPMQKQQALAQLNRKLNIVDPHKLYRSDSLGTHMTPADKFAANNIKFFPEHGLAVAIDQKGLPHWQSIPQKKEALPPEHQKPEAQLGHVLKLRQQYPEATDEQIHAMARADFGHVNSLQNPNKFPQPGGVPAGVPSAGLKTQHQLQQEAKNKAVQEKIVEDNRKRREISFRHHLGEEIKMQEKNHKLKHANDPDPPEFSADYEAARTNALKRVEQEDKALDPNYKPTPPPALPPAPAATPPPSPTVLDAQADVLREAQKDRKKRQAEAIDKEAANRAAQAPGGEEYKWWKVPFSAGLGIK